MSVRDTIRSKIFASKDFAKEEVDFFGEKLELRQPNLGQVLAVQSDDDRQSAVIDTLIKYAYVPGTEEKVFESGDSAALLELPFGADFVRISTALEKLTSVNFLDKGDISSKDQTSTS
jgi:hypothetical protein